MTATSACGSSGGTTAPPATTPTCADYCAAITAACTGSHQQYSDVDFCMASCLAFTVGAGADTSGDTPGCRQTWAHKATTNASSCTAAGPGGDGVCGDNCGGYCDIVMKYCSDANNAKIYDTRAACLSDCATHQTDAKLSAGDTDRTDTGNEVACVLYHAQMGAVAPDEHCLGDLALTAGTCRENP